MCRVFLGYSGFPRGGQTRRLAIQQNLHTLPHRGFGFCAQNLIAVIRNGVGNHGKTVLGKPGYLSHDLCRLRKAVGDDRGGRHLNLLCRKGVVQTARRTAPSITDRGDHRVTARHLGHNFGRRRATGIRFF